MLWVCGVAGIGAEVLIFIAFSKAAGNYLDGAIAWGVFGGLAAFIVWWFVENFLVSVKAAVK